MDRHSLSVCAPGQSAAPRSLSTTPAAGFNLQAMLKCAEKDRDLTWLSDMLQFAVQLEFATIPPYLAAYWSVKPTSSSVVQNMILSVALQEMLHMGLVCNIMTSLGTTPKIADAAVVPQYPGHLPGRVHPTLWVELRPLSRELIADTFMVIEEPENGPIRYSQGQTYPTIGAFYSAIQESLRKLPDHAFSGDRQVVLNRPDFALGAVATRDDALNAIETIKEQGEGESGSPLYGPGASDMAHYYLFGQIFYERTLVEVAPGDWQYTGDEITFPTADEIYPMAPVPAGGYPEGDRFDREYTRMLAQLQDAWEQGGAAGGAALTQAQRTMGELGRLAVELMETPVQTGSPFTMGPGFRLIS